MKIAFKYIIITVAFAFLSSGALVAGFLDIYDSLGNQMFLLLLPMTALFITAVVINDCILIPHLLLKARLAGYSTAVSAVVYAVILLSLALEYATRRLLDLPMRIADYSSIWILADTLSNGLLLAMIILGLGLLNLFNRWQQEVAMKKTLTDKLQSYIDIVKIRLDPSFIFSRLFSISSNRHADLEEIETGIRDLSDYLRKQLYEMPGPPEIRATEFDDTRHSRIAVLLVSSKFRYARHFIFIGILMIISFGAFFSTPDTPEFSFDRFLGVLSMFAILAIVAYTNILWLYPRFMKRGNIRRYAVSVTILLLAIAIPLIILQIHTYEPNVYSRQLPVFIAFISTIGSLMSLFMFIGGVSAALLLQNWIDTKQKLTLLRAETIRQEYVYLRKQINPHFLFNVLNNIGITVYDDPVCARALINDLITLLKYQLENMGRETTTLSQELSFIRSYFALEATRRETFNYLIDTDASDENVNIPTLLFIPFIENAVKYSISNTGMPEVTVSFTVRKNILTFVCVNPYDKKRIENLHNGGIGLDNTRRRLDMLYERDYSLHCDKTEKTYSVRLEIPLQ